jgi:hypothetical protein
VSVLAVIAPMRAREKLRYRLFISDTTERPMTKSEGGMTKEIRMTKHESR